MTHFETNNTAAVVRILNLPFNVYLFDDHTWGYRKKGHALTFLGAKMCQLIINPLHRAITVIIVLTAKTRKYTKLQRCRN